MTDFQKYDGKSDKSLERNTSYRPELYLLGVLGLVSYFLHCKLQCGSELCNSKTEPLLSPENEEPGTLLDHQTALKCEYGQRVTFSGVDSLLSKLHFLCIPQILPALTMININNGNSLVLFLLQLETQPYLWIFI